MYSYHHFKFLFSFTIMWYWLQNIISIIKAEMLLKLRSFKVHLMTFIMRENYINALAFRLVSWPIITSTKRKYDKRDLDLLLFFSFSLLFLSLFALSMFFFCSCQKCKQNKKDYTRNVKKISPKISRKDCTLTNTRRLVEYIVWETRM